MSVVSLPPIGDRGIILITLSLNYNKDGDTLITLIFSHIQHQVSTWLYGRVEITSNIADELNTYLVPYMNNIFLSQLVDLWPLYSCFRVEICE